MIAETAFKKEVSPEPGLYNEKIRQELEFFKNCRDVVCDIPAKKLQFDQYYIEIRKSNTKMNRSS